jgi:hypothetical protein
MLIREFAEDSTAQRLAMMTQFMIGRAEDQAAKMQISIDAYINAAKSMNINLTPQTLADMAGQDPLKNLIEPIEPNSGVIRFKGNTEAATGMSVNNAREVVNKNAKAAMRRGMK